MTNMTEKNKQTTLLFLWWVGVRHGPKWR